VTKTIESRKSPRIVIADDAGLLYSDDWRRGWVAGFKEIGCNVTVVNISQLRRAMGGGAFSVRGDSSAAALADQIASAKPDLVWCHHGRAAGHEFFLSKLKRRGIRTAVYLCDEPYECGETARYSPRFDSVFSMDWCTVDLHRGARPFSQRSNVYYLPPCADTNLFTRRNYENRNVPAFFLGNPSLHPRSAWLKAVEAAVSGADIRYWPDRGRPVAKGHRNWIAAEDHPKHYSGCIVGLNVHRHPGITKECYRTRVHGRQRNIAIPTGMVLAARAPTVDGTGFWNDPDLPASHVNPRFFEFAASGTLVVSDDTRSELERMFPAAPRARDVTHFVELVHYYIDHTDEAEEIGRSCSVQVSKRHTYRHRAFEVLIRLGLSDLVPEVHASSLGAQADFLTPQDLRQQMETLSSERTGRSELWTPAFGLSLTRMSGDPSQLSSLDAPPLLRPW
jgi:spore maturation protein CgeB